jgi:NNP family nitrate/nitrite transporter-like MFS transporter
MLFGFLFKSSSITYLQAFQYIGVAVIIVSLVVLVTKFAVTEKTVKVGAVELQAI